MRTFNSQQWAQDLNGHWMDGKNPGQITGFSFDTRTLNPGDLFLALKGESRDGHEYLNLACQKGASAAIVEAFNPAIPLPQLKVDDSLKAFQQIARSHRQHFKGTVFGVTGSCGKTTTKDLLTLLLGKDRTHATLLNNNNLLGVPLTLIGLDPIVHDYAVIEAGTNMTGEMECLASMIQPDISIITNVYPVHLDGLGSLEGIAHQKCFLAQATRANGHVLFPSSCLQFNPFQLLGNRAKVLVYEGEDCGLPKQNTIFYRIEENHDKTMSLIIKLPNSLSEQEYVLPLLSRGVLSNVALAISAGLLVGIEASQVKERLKTWLPSTHRGQIYHYGKQSYYADCYNANPVAMQDALNVFQKHFDSSYNHLYILGCMGELGEEAPKYHYQIGAALSLKKEDQILLIGEHSRDYERGLKDAGNRPSQIICLQNKEKAFEYLRCFEGAIFLKGSKPYALWELLPSAKQFEVTI